MNIFYKMIRFKSSIVLLTFWVIISSQCVTCDNEEGFFTVVGSSLIKFQKPYHASVTYQGFKSDKVIQIGVRKTKERDDDVSWSFYDKFLSSS